MTVCVDAMPFGLLLVLGGRLVGAENDSHVSIACKMLVKYCARCFKLLIEIGTVGVAVR